MKELISKFLSWLSTKLNPDQLYWVQWLQLFFLKELPEAFDDEKGGTFSEFVWYIKNLRPWTKLVLGPALFAFCVDLGLHFFLETPLWPF